MLCRLAASNPAGTGCAGDRGAAPPPASVPEMMRMLPRGRKDGAPSGGAAEGGRGEGWGSAAPPAAPPPVPQAAHAAGLASPVPPPAVSREESGAGSDGDGPVASGAAAGWCAASVAAGGW